MLNFVVNLLPFMRKLLTAIFAALVVAAVGLPMHAQAARVNTLVKGSGPTIYWAADNGKKYSFPNVATFYTWFTSNDMKAVKKITDKELKSIPTSGNVTYRGGAKLVKFPNESTVYAVSRYSVLRPIANQDVATQLYGWNWSSWVENLPWNLRGDYSIGSTIRSSADYSPSNEYNGVKTPTDNLSQSQYSSNPSTSYQPTQPVAQFNGSVTLTLGNRSYTPDRAQFTATVSNSNRDANQITIQIKNETRNEIVQTCYASYTCSATFYVDTVATQEFVALAKDAAGYSLGSNRVSVQGNSYPYYSSYNTYPYSNTYNTYPYYNYNNSYTYPYYNNTFAADRSLTAEWTADRTLKLVGRITSYNRPITDLRMAIIDTTNNQTIKYCDGTDACNYDVRTDSNWINSTRYALRVYEVNGQEMGYVYANSVGTNTYANDYYNNYSYNGYNYGYNYGYNNGYYTYGTPSVTTYVSRWNDSWSFPTVTVTGNVSGVSYLSNTRLELYAVGGSWNNNAPRLLNTCYNTSTCTSQDTPATSYGTSYYTVFVDGNGLRSYSENRSY